MPVTIQSLLNQYIEALTKIYGTHLKSVILYGSYARGDYTRDSDIGIKHIAKSEEHFKKWVSAYPFYSNVEKEEVKLNRNIRKGTIYFPTAPYVFHREYQRLDEIKNPQIYSF